MRSFLLIALLLGVGCSRQANGDLSRPSYPTAQTRANQPFGQHHHRYADGSIAPSSSSQATLDQAVVTFYEHWKRSYLTAGCAPGQYYVKANSVPGMLTESKATGYGMLIVSIMAGHDADAKQYFDGMLRYFRAHQSALTDGLMAWYQDEECRDAQGDNSATNADLDIAYALLLADRQWGSCGSVNYAEHARWVIAAISQGELHREGRYMLLGDWVAPSNRRLYNGTRSSDFMPAHFRGFQHFMQQEWWVQVIDNGYWLLQTVQSRYSPDAGLLPDFIEMADSETPTPAAPDFLQREYLGEYAGIAALVPLRVGADFLLSGDMRAKRLLERVNTFVRTRSGDDPGQIQAGYALQGRAFGADQSMAFTAPFGVSAMLDKSHQDWLNRLWERVVAHPPEQSLEDSIRLLSMLLMSGNWWAPNRAADPCTKQSTHTSASR